MADAAQSQRRGAGALAPAFGRGRERRAGGRAHGPPLGGDERQPRDRRSPALRRRDGASADARRRLHAAPSGRAWRTRGNRPGPHRSRCRSERVGRRHGRHRVALRGTGRLRRDGSACSPRAGADVDAPDHFQSRTPLVFAASRNATKAITAPCSRRGPIRHFRRTSRTTWRARTWIATTGPVGRASARRSVVTSRSATTTRIASSRRSFPRIRPPPTRRKRRRTMKTRQRKPEEEEKEPEQPPVTALSSTEQIGVQGGLTALHYAARQGNIEAAELLLDGGADIDQPTGGDQSTPLLVAAVNGNYDLAMMLVERGADPNIVSDDGVGPLFATLNIEWSLRTWYPQPQAFRIQNHSYLDLMEALLEAGRRPERTDVHARLVRRVQRGSHGRRLHGRDAVLARRLRDRRHRDAPPPLVWRRPRHLDDEAARTVGATSIPATRARAPIRTKRKSSILPACPRFRSAGPRCIRSTPRPASASGRRVWHSSTGAFRTAGSRP